MQLIKVTAFAEDKPEGTLLCYDENGVIGSSIPVLLGKKGVTLSKKEGDGKTPLGTFSLGMVFGDKAHKVYAQKTAYLTLSEGVEWVDDPASPYYNKLIQPDFLGSRSWISSEKMWQIAPYALGVVVEYNTNPIIPGKGSAIFMHLAEGRGTSGCISMKESDLCRVVAWLDPKKEPKIEIATDQQSIGNCH